MNASTAVQHMQQQVTGALLYAGYQYDDGLALDLYGSCDEDGHIVESVAVAGTTVEIGQLFSARKLELFGLWLDTKDGGAAERAWADKHRYELATDLKAVAGCCYHPARSVLPKIGTVCSMTGPLALRQVPPDWRNQSLHAWRLRCYRSQHGRPEGRTKEHKLGRRTPCTSPSSVKRGDRDRAVRARRSRQSCGECAG